MWRFRNSLLATAALSGLVKCFHLSHADKKFINGEDLEGGDLELVLAQVFFRHGARAPFADTPDGCLIWTESLRANLHSTPKLQRLNLQDMSPLPDSMSPDEAKLRGGLSAGSLTFAGLQQAEELGIILRQRYVDSGFVSKEFNPNEVLLRCTATDRTAETLRGVLKGMYPGAHEVPVLVGVEGQGSEYTDWLKFSPGSCPRLLALYRAARRALADHRSPETRQLLVDLQAATGLTLSEGLAEWGPVVWLEWASCRAGSGLPPMKGMSPEALQAVGQAATDEARRLFQGAGVADPREMLRLAQGRTVGEVVGRVLSAMLQDQGSPGPVEPKVVAYSAHDWTLLPLLLMLAPPAFQAEWPRFGAELRLELLRRGRDGPYLVRALYSAGAPALGARRGPLRAVPLAACGGGLICPVEVLLQHAGQFVPGDVDRECGLPSRREPDDD